MFTDPAIAGTVKKQPAGRQAARLRGYAVGRFLARPRAATATEYLPGRSTITSRGEDLGWTRESPRDSD